MSIGHPDRIVQICFPWESFLLVVGVCFYSRVRHDGSRWRGDGVVVGQPGTSPASDKRASVTVVKGFWGSILLLLVRHLLLLVRHLFLLASCYSFIPQKLQTALERICWESKSCLSTVGPSLGSLDLRRLRV